MTTPLQAFDILTQAQYQATCSDFVFDSDGKITGGRIINSDLFDKFDRIAMYLMFV